MSRNMIMGSIGIIGIGEGGCNIASKFEQFGYKKVFYINSAMKDLDKIETSPENMYHIPNASGCVRNREKAKEYLKENYDIILNNVQGKLSNLRIIFCIFSMGGGTGSGMTPMLINALMKRLPNTTFNVIGIIPDSLSSPRMKYNACECYNEIKKLKSGLGNIYFINNDNACQDGKMSVKLETLDNSLISRIHNIVTVSDSSGSVDEAEVLELLSTPGNVLIGDIVDDKNDMKVIYDVSLTPTKSGCEYLLYSINEMSTSTRDTVEEEFGIPSDSFTAHNDDSDFVAAFGMSLPEDVFNLLKEETEVVMDLREEVEETESLDISSLNSRFSKSKVSPKIKEKAKKNSQSLLDDLEDF